MADILQDLIDVVAPLDDLLGRTLLLQADLSITLLAVECQGDHRRIVLERQDEAQLLHHQIWDFRLRIEVLVRDDDSVPAAAVAQPLHEG